MKNKKLATLLLLILFLKLALVLFSIEETLNVPFLSTCQI